MKIESTYSTMGDIQNAIILASFRCRKRCLLSYLFCSTRLVKYLVGFYHFSCSDRDRVRVKAKLGLGVTNPLLKSLSMSPRNTFFDHHLRYFNIIKNFCNNN